MNNVESRERMTQILTWCDGGAVAELIEDATLSNGERIEQLRGILANIWEVANAHKEATPFVYEVPRGTDFYDVGASNK